MASWMILASFVLLVIVLMVVIACLVILIIKLFEVTTGCTGATVSSSSSTSINNNLNSFVSVASVTSSFFGDGRDRDAEFVKLGEIQMKKDAFYNNLKLDSCILNTNGYRLFVAGTLQLLNGSVIQNAGKDGGSNTSFGNGPVPGGLGAPAGTLGGGGNGGSGYLKESAASKINGDPSKNAVWGTVTTLFSGADGSLSSAVADFGIGLAGKVSTNTARTKFDVAQALNANVVPTVPIMSGGSGGGGGQGAAAYPGSGGGGGGGVVVIAARTLVVAKGGGSINVSGGNGGILKEGGPFNATSGGGGGGGLIVLASESPESSYEGLVMKVDGGLSVDSLGYSVQANQGRIINWFQSNESDSNPMQFIVAHSTAPQTLSSSQMQKSVLFQEIDYSSAGILRDAEGSVFTVDQSGLYMISADLSTDSNAAVSGYLVKNGDPDDEVFGTKTLQNIGKSQTLSMWAVVPLNQKDTFEIRLVADSHDDPISIKNPSSIAAFLLAPQ